MLDSKKKVIKGRTFHTMPFGARRQLALLPGVLRLLSGPVGTLVEALKGLAGEDGPLAKMQAGGTVTAKDIEIGPILTALKGEALTTGLRAIADELENGGDELIMELLRDTTRMKGQKQTDGLESCADDFDTVFQGDFLTLLQVLAFVLKVNFAPFL